jgi:hypothetical protein
MQVPATFAAGIIGVAGAALLDAAGVEAPDEGNKFAGGGDRLVTAIPGVRTLGLEDGTTGAAGRPVDGLAAVSLGR